MSEYGLTRAGAPCKSCQKLGDFCAQHEDQRPAPAPAPQISGGKAVAHRVYEEMVQARVNEGVATPLSEKIDVLAELRTIMVQGFGAMQQSIEQQAEEVRQMKVRAAQQEERQQRIEDMQKAMNIRSAELAEQWSDGARAQAQAMAAQRIQELTTGGDLEARVQEQSAREQLLAARRSPMRWSGEPAIFSISGLSLLLVSNDNPHGVIDNSPALVVDQRGAIVGRLEGGVPHTFRAEIDYSQRYRAAYQGHHGAMQQALKLKEHNTVNIAASGMADVDARLGIRTGDRSANLRETISALPH